MKHFFFMFALFAISCAPLLEEGIYDVTFQVTTDSCNFFPESLSLSPTIPMTISETNDGYKIEFSDVIYRGEEDDGLIVFEKTESTTVDGCLLTVTSIIILDPDDGTSFSGKIDETYFYNCSSGSCKLVFSMEGKIQE